MMENHRTLTSLDGPSNRDTPERCPRPLYTQDCTGENYRILQEYKGDLTDIKIEVIDGEEEMYVMGDQQFKEEDIPTDNSTDGSSNRNTPERCPRPRYSQDCTEETHRFPQEHQSESLIDIKIEDIEEEEEMYMRVDQQCKEEEIPTDISTYFKTEDNMAAAFQGENSIAMYMHPAHHGAEMSSSHWNHGESSDNSGGSTFRKHSLHETEDDGDDGEAEEGSSTSRAPRFSEEENEILVEGVLRNYEVLLGSLSQQTSHKAKTAIWKEIASAVSTQGVQPRSIEICKKRYRDCKRITKNKMGRIDKHAKDTGGGELRLIFKTWEERVRQHLSRDVEGGADTSFSLTSQECAPTRMPELQRKKTAPKEVQRKREGMSGSTYPSSSASSSITVVIEEEPRAGRFQCSTAKAGTSYSSYSEGQRKAKDGGVAVHAKTRPFQASGSDSPSAEAKKPMKRKGPDEKETAKRRPIEEEASAHLPVAEEPRSRASRHLEEVERSGNASSQAFSPIVTDTLDILRSSTTTFRMEDIFGTQSQDEDSDPPEIEVVTAALSPPQTSTQTATTHPCPASIPVDDPPKDPPQSDLMTNFARDMDRKHEVHSRRTEASIQAISGAVDHLTNQVSVCVNRLSNQMSETIGRLSAQRPTVSERRMESDHNLIALFERIAATQERIATSQELMTSYQIRMTRTQEQMSASLQQVVTNCQLIETHLQVIADDVRSRGNSSVTIPDSSMSPQVTKPLAEEVVEDSRQSTSGQPTVPSTSGRPETPIPE
ncbi:uncharacterized protein LOC135056975 [Pseudophryne corroboree]|uniref:uncharacterized protein LOC135056975 n=1 Tax=Pseudophryne corroboree TaxID=495146 RepID=UPI003081B4FF